MGLLNGTVIVSRDDTSLVGFGVLHSTVLVHNQKTSNTLMKRRLAIALDGPTRSNFSNYDRSLPPKTCEIASPIDRPNARTHDLPPRRATRSDENSTVYSSTPREQTRHWRTVLFTRPDHGREHDCSHSTTRRRVAPPIAVTGEIHGASNLMPRHSL